MRKLVLSLLFIIIGSIILYVALSIIAMDASKLCENGFLFNFIGILLGFSLTIFTFIVSMVEKIKDRAESKFHNDETKRIKVQRIIDSLYREIKDNIFFNFLSLILIGIIYLLFNLKPTFNIFHFEVNTERLLNSIKLSIFFLNLYAIYDLIIVSFKLSDTVGILKKADDDFSKK